MAYAKIHTNILSNIREILEESYINLLPTDHAY